METLVLRNEQWRVDANDRETDGQEEIHCGITSQETKHSGADQVKAVVVKNILRRSSDHCCLSAFSKSMNVERASRDVSLVLAVDVKDAEKTKHSTSVCEFIYKL
jgi:hypothetical protein